MMYREFKALPIDHAAIGLEQSDSHVTYYCTPEGAEIIGWAGVDGIHYCTIEGFGEMIFAVSPMNFGDCVHPIARNFEDLLCLLLSCGDMAALEQCYAWDEEQFKAFLIDCPVTQQQKAVLDELCKVFALEPMEDAFAYVKQLQSEFDLSKIPYPEDYYDPDMNAAAPERETEWKVTYNGGFWGSKGKPGMEVTIDKTFYWGSEKWYIPAIYLCAEGLVIDYFMEADPEEVTAFIHKWDLLHEDGNSYTKEQQEQMEREHPVNAHFFGKVCLNGQSLKNGHGSGLTWLPASCFPEGFCRNEDAKGILAHYGLDEDRAWAIHRWSYAWNGETMPELQSLSVRMERQPEHIPGEKFAAPAAGESIILTHPITRGSYTLTVHEEEQQVLPEHAFPDPGMEYPRHFLAVSYSIEPDLSGADFLLRDCGEGDRPRQKKPATDGYVPTAVNDAAVIGIIGGADGPTAIMMGQSTPKLHAACSNLHFKAVAQVQWQPVFRVKRMEDVEICLR